jgi:hypothetical protein
VRGAGRRIDPADLPPGLEWEKPVWELYELLHGQWRYGFGGRTGLDYGPALALMHARGWDPDLGAALLRAIEREVLNQDAIRREREEPGKD